jgi:hypothetical protein
MRDSRQQVYVTLFSVDQIRYVREKKIVICQPVVSECVDIGCSKQFTNQLRKSLRQQ